MEQQMLQSVLADVPNYEAFLTVDELNLSAHQLATEYPDIVTLMTIGQSRQGDPIEVLKIGSGANTALMFAMPHPNEPIGSMMLEYLSRRLAEDSDLRDSLDYTWYIAKCVDPDGTRLNEGWFKGPFSIGNYGRHYYRPPSHLQVEWSFPINYKKLRFDAPMPETQALMALIEEIRPDFIYSLHNSGFGGAYFYMSEGAPALYSAFHELVANQGLHLHMGEPEIVWVDQFADAIFQTPSITTMYDFLEKQGVDPSKAITGGNSSFDYAKQFCDPFSLICEMPYFEAAAIHDTSPSNMIRRDAILTGVELTREGLGLVEDIFGTIQNELTEPSPFIDAISGFLHAIPQYLAAQAGWAKSDPAAEELATVAQKLDSLAIRRFYMVFLLLGMVVRMIENQIALTGETQALSAALKQAETAFGKLQDELESELEYSVVPIRKLVSVQLGSALLAASYAAAR